MGVTDGVGVEVPDCVGVLDGVAIAVGACVGIADGVHPAIMASATALTSTPGRQLLQTTRIPFRFYP